jgi:hypothetical protein
MKTPREAWEELPPEIAKHIPQSDWWAIDPVVRTHYIQKEIKRRHRLARMLADGFDLETDRTVWTPDKVVYKRQKFKESCAADPIFFIDNCIWTKDPEGKVGVNQDLPLKVFEYARKFWLGRWIQEIEDRTGRTTHDKSRRMLLSIYRMALEVWCMRFLPGSKSWVATDKQTKLDNWYDFDSLLGKFRVMWDYCVKGYPWLFPELPPHTEVNKLNYLRFPEWVIDGVKIDEMKKSGTTNSRRCCRLIPEVVLLSGGSWMRQLGSRN